ESGYSDIAATVRAAIRAGAVGCNLEDAMKRRDHAVRAVETAVAASRMQGIPSWSTPAPTPTSQVRPRPPSARARNRRTSSRPWGGGLRLAVDRCDLAGACAATSV